MPAKRVFPLDETWLRWQKTAEALHNAEEVDDFQAVGVRCRECLLSCVRAMSPLVMIPDGHSRPKAGDFVHWAELITELMIPNQGYDEVRNYLKSMSKTTWQMANWLAHSSHAERFDAELAVEAVQAVLAATSTALTRYETARRKKRQTGVSSRNRDIQPT